MNRRRPPSLQSAWRCLCRRDDGDELIMAYAIFVICFVLFSR